MEGGNAPTSIISLGNVQ